MVLGIGGSRDNEPTATPGVSLEKLHPGGPARLQAAEFSIL